MDTEQQNHLKAYGLVYKAIEKNLKANWLLYYRGGSFAIEYSEDIKQDCNIRGVSYYILSASEMDSLLKEIASPSVNMDAVLLEKAPKIAIYSPKDKMPWDDAVTLVLEYAEIPYTLIYDKEILSNELVKYQWLHLHHEDFTGQYGKFYNSFKTAPWYVRRKKDAEKLATELGYSKVSQQKLDVAIGISDYVKAGGFMFAMCSATDSFDIALAANGVDICEIMFDGDPSEADYQSKLNTDNCFAFEKFKLSTNPSQYEFSDIDTTTKRKIDPTSDYFILEQYSAKWDQIPAMLCQNHTKIVKSFMGQTTGFSDENIKSNILKMGKHNLTSEVKYLHGVKGKGMFSFYGGHDPEDYTHRVGDPKTVLNLHPNSPGYRLILNNILFPAAKKKKQKT